MNTAYFEWISFKHIARNQKKLYQLYPQNSRKKWSKSVKNTQKTRKTEKLVEQFPHQSSMICCVEYARPLDSILFMRQKGFAVICCVYVFTIVDLLSLLSCIYGICLIFYDLLQDFGGPSKAGKPFTMAHTTDLKSCESLDAGVAVNAPDKSLNMSDDALDAQIAVPWM